MWEDADGKVHLSYNDPEFLKLRHGINESDEEIQQISNALQNISEAAAAN